MAHASIVARILGAPPTVHSMCLHPRLTRTWYVLVSAAHSNKIEGVKGAAVIKCTVFKRAHAGQGKRRIVSFNYKVSTVFEDELFTAHLVHNDF